VRSVSAPVFSTRIWEPPEGIFIAVGFEARMLTC